MLLYILFSGELPMGRPRINKYRKKNYLPTVPAWLRLDTRQDKRKRHQIPMPGFLLQNDAH